MALGPTSLAAAVGVSANNQVLAPSAEILPRKIGVIGTYDPSILTVADEVPVQVLSPEDAADKFGAGFMIPRLVDKVFDGSNGIECYVIPQAEPGGGSQAAGTLTVTGTVTVAGTVHLYIAGSYVPVNVLKGDDAEAVALKINNAINADTDLPVTSAVDGVSAEELDITAKTSGTYGNEIIMRLNVGGLDQVTPSGITTIALVQLSGGAGTPTIADALNGLGTGDSANLLGITDLVHGYLQDSTTLDAISAYNGEGNDTVGLYSKTVSRPFRALTGDRDPGSDALTAIRAVGDGRKSTDRTNGVVAVPDSPNHPSEIAAVAIGVLAKTNNVRAEESYVDALLPGIFPGADGSVTSSAGRWTDDYDNRNSAVTSGVSPTKVTPDGAVLLQNVLSFYHPASIPVSSNGYRSMRNISIVQNLLASVRANFEQDRWKGVSLVADKTKVSNLSSGAKAVSASTVKTDYVALANAWESRAWLFSASYTKDNLQVSLRSGGIGFDSVIPVVLSGEVGIIDTEIKFDTALTVFTV